MLPTRVAIFDINDVEAFCQQVIKRSGFKLTSDQRDELLLQLLADTCRLSDRYNPGTGTFSTLAGGVLPKRAVDWYRKEFGRTRYSFKGTVVEHAKTVLVELDERTVTTPEVDPAERDDPVESGVDGVGAIPASAYFPPRHLLDGRRVHRALVGEADRDLVQVEAA